MLLLKPLQYEQRDDEELKISSIGTDSLMRGSGSITRDGYEDGTSGSGWTALFALMRGRLSILAS